MTDSSTAVEALLGGLSRTRDWQEDFYRDLHAHPELSHQKYATARKVAARLRDRGYDVHDRIGGTGVVGVLRNGPGPTVLLRADMDALPMKEATGLDYANTVQTTDDNGNQVPVIHACGHDVHVAALLGAAQLFADGSDHWSGTLITVFQPAEETAHGARAMVDRPDLPSSPPITTPLTQRRQPLERHASARSPFSSDETAPVHSLVGRWTRVLARKLLQTHCGRRRRGAYRTATDSVTSCRRNTRAASSRAEPKSDLRTAATVGRGPAQ